MKEVHGGDLNGVLVSLRPIRCLDVFPEKTTLPLAVAQSSDHVSFDPPLEQVIDDLNNHVRIGVVDKGRSVEFDT